MKCGEGDEGKLLRWGQRNDRCIALVHSLKWKFTHSRQQATKCKWYSVNYLYHWGNMFSGISDRTGPIILTWRSMRASVELLVALSEARMLKTASMKILNLSGFMVGFGIIDTRGGRGCPDEGDPLFFLLSCVVRGVLSDLSCILSFFISNSSEKVTYFFIVPLTRFFYSFRYMYMYKKASLFFYLFYLLLPHSHLKLHSVLAFFFSFQTMSLWVAVHSFPSSTFLPFRSPPQVHLV